MRNRYHTARKAVINFLIDKGLLRPGLNTGFRSHLDHLEMMLGLKSLPRGSYGSSAKNRVIRIADHLPNPLLRLRDDQRLIRYMLSQQLGEPYPGRSKSVGTVSVKCARQFYHSHEWKKLRYSILVKHGRICMACGTSEGIMNVDHIKPLRYYWSLRLDKNNLQVLCSNCNEGKSNWDQTDWREESDLDKTLVYSNVVTDRR